MHDVIVIGGGFAGVTAAREATLGGASVLLLEARDRLGGRTWTHRWNDTDVELGGGWVHWHQPHVWAEITRAGLGVELGEDAQISSWFVGDERREGSITERDAIAERGWDRFVDGVLQALPLPHDPLLFGDELARFDRQTIAERLDELELDEEERDVLRAELESLAHGHLDDAGAVAVLRWHALSGGSLALTQQTGGRITFLDGTQSLVQAIWRKAPYETRLETPVATVTQEDGRVEVHTRAGEVRVRVDDALRATLTSVAPRVEALDAGRLKAILAALRWRADELDPALPPAVAYAGAWHPIIAVAKRERLARLDYDFDALGALMARHDLLTVNLVWREDATRFHARNPFPPGGVVEDPATGAAAAALGAYLAAHRALPPQRTFVIHQGHELGRPSLLTVHVPDEARAGIQVSGAAVALGT